VKPGTLFVVGTPIGNLDDITLRALKILGQVAVVAAEDTRAAQHLLAHHGLKRPTLSYFEGNEAARTEALCARLAAGEDVALISEAGMPGVSDPGHRLIARAIQAGIGVTVIPGPSASVTALVGSGLPTAEFYFVGFPPRDAGPRGALFGGLRGLPATLVFYEAPLRVAATLRDLSAALGGTRPACLARELTKIHEELVRGTLGELAARYAEVPPRGEVTLVIGGAGADAVPEPLDLEAEVRRRVEAGQTPKEIAAALSLLSGKPRRQIYQLALALRPRG
jgi:16S rRNA (cytidine1402-2'-O)-methyltransferase